MIVRVPWQEGLVGFLDQAGVEILRYTYDPNSRLTNRWSKAKGNTIYSYDPVGNLTNVNYPSSPDVRFAYDPLNRVTNMVDAAGTTKYAYTAGGQLWTEDLPAPRLRQAGGPWSNDTVTNTYTYRMRTGLALQQPTGTWTNGFWHDYARRLTNVTSPAGSFDYLFAGVTHHASRLTLPNTSYITNHYDNTARLLFTKLNNSSHTTLNKHEYVYNTGNQRTKHTRTDDSHLTFSYDPIGQLTIARATNSGGTLLSGETRGYLYDAAWNLNVRTNNGSGATESFAVNSRNELTSGPGGSFSHDDNGNLSYYGQQYGWERYFTYDDENQLVSVQVPGYFYSLYTYDGLGRRRKRVEHTWNGSAWSVSQTVHYVYDGMRVIQERDGNHTPTVSYTRGSDLSGSLEGAGGIGGLLARSHGYSSGNWSTHNFYHADAGGNVTYLVNSSQTLAASYKYDPYGRVTSQSGALSSANLYRFSSKEVNLNYPDAGGLYYYGYRWYAPSLQRWLNRDPIGEWGGINLYGFVGNMPVNFVDPYGFELRSFYGHDTVGSLYPSGPVPYLTGDTVVENLGAGAYNMIPLVNNTLVSALDTLGYAIEGVAGFAGWATEKLGGSPADGELVQRAMLAAAVVIGPKGKVCSAAKTGLTTPGNVPLGFTRVELTEGSFVNRVYDSSGAAGRSGLFGQSFSPGAGLPTDAASAITSRGLNPAFNNAQAGAVFRVNQNITVYQGTSLGGTAPELFIPNGLHQYITPVIRNVPIVP